MEDQKIVKLLWQRAESAIEALARKFGNRLMSIAMNILGGRQDAEETVKNIIYLGLPAVAEKILEKPLENKAEKDG